ncbi:GyrI-like domain-containing protein [Rhodoglobus aureus]
MSPEIIVETVATRLVAGLEFSTTMAALPEDMTRAIGSLVQNVTEAQMTVIGPLIAVYMEEMHADRPWKCEVCVPVSEAFGEHPTLRSHELPGGVVATVTHVGSYDGLKATYNSVFGWFTQHGHTHAGPPREIYLNSADEVAEEQLLTRLEFPVVLASS